MWNLVVDPRGRRSFRHQRQRHSGCGRRSGRRQGCQPGFWLASSVTDLTVRYQPQFRRSVEDIGNIRILAPSGERVALSQVSHISLDDGASTIYREGNSRYIAI